MSKMKTLMLRFFLSPDLISYDLANSLPVIFQNDLALMAFVCLSYIRPMGGVTPV